MLEERQDRAEIVEFLRERFAERYIIPLESMQSRNGFIIMAVSCLLIEGIQSFREGWTQPTEKRRKPYRRFFRDYPSFGVSPFQADELYDNIRSGILHQGETYQGWRILRKGKLIAFDEKTLNASAFFKEVKKAFDQYLGKLEKANWGSPVWQRFRNRMNAVIKNCEPG